MNALNDIPQKSGHTNNWAVLISTSKFWYNYRHSANALTMYRTVKRLGIPDSNIILMLAEDIACNPRNKYPGKIFNKHGKKEENNLYGESIEIDYRGSEVTVENFIRVLTGHVHPNTPRSKRLLSDDRSNIVIYMTGHGGKDFLKFQDSEQISSYDLADTFAQMFEKRRYHEILFMIDTCHADSMYQKIHSPNIIAMGSSGIEEDSYSYYPDSDIGVSLIDRWTNFNLEFLEKVDIQSQASIQDLIDRWNPKEIASTPCVRTDLFPRALNHTKLTDFLGNVQQVHVTERTYTFNATKFSTKKHLPSIRDYVQNSYSSSDTPLQPFVQKLELASSDQWIFPFCFTLILLYIILKLKY